MPRVTITQTNFTSGEISPRLLGRTDLPLYKNGAEIIENALPLIHGGARRRDGFRYVASAKNATKKAIMVPFVFSTTDAYMLEVGDLYMRFYKNTAQLGGPYEIATPFTEAMLPDLSFRQSADTMIMVHPNVAPQRLRRFADTNWSIDTIPFDVLPFDEIGHSFSVTLTLSAATVGAGRTVTASGGVFLNSDVGRLILYQGGALKITAFTDVSHVTGDVLSAFPSVNVPADVWTLDGSPQESITPSAKDPVESTITLTAAALNTWRAADVGKFVRINGGLAQITAFTSATVVSAKIKEVLSAAASAVPANAWSLEAPVWSAGNGYPRAVTFYQQRLCLGGTLAYPATVWGSSVGAYLDFTLGTQDSDGFAYSIASDQINPIVQLASGKVMFSFTYGGEFTIKGGVEKPITPTNVQVENQSSYGAINIPPARVGKEILFVDQSGRQLLASTYAASDEDYDADDLTLFAEHISLGGFKGLSYQRTPDPIVWAPRVDGVLPSLSLSRKQDVAAWARQITDGVIESVATIPVLGGHQTWALIQRTVNNATVRYIEVIDPAVLTDSAITGTSGPGQAVLPVPHLIGKSVDCVADGRYMGRFVVSGGGTITLSRNAFAWQIGLPYTSRIKLLTPEIDSADGSAQGNAMSTHEVVVRFLNTYACKVNGNDVAFRHFGTGLLDQPLTPFTGLKRLENLGWENGSSDIELTSDLPLPFHVLAVIRKFTVNAG
jgi:hypothetical protein